MSPLSLTLPSSACCCRHFCAPPGEPARPQGAAHRPCRQGGREDPHLGRRALQLHQPRPRPSTPHRHFLGRNPQFCRSALARFTPADFIALVQNRIPFPRKHKGQLSATARPRTSSPCCWPNARQRAGQALAALHRQKCRSIFGIKRLIHQRGYQIDTDRGSVRRRWSSPRAACPFPRSAPPTGYRLAQQFDIPLIERRPGLVPLTFDGEGLGALCATGRAGPARADQHRQQEARMVRRRPAVHPPGLSAPVLQISSYWQPGTPLAIDLAPGVPLSCALARARARSRLLIANELATLVPARLADAWARKAADWQRLSTKPPTRPWRAWPNGWPAGAPPTGTEGY